MRPTVPFQPSGRHSSATPSDGTRCAFGSTSSTRSAGIKRFLSQSAHSPMGISSIKRTSNAPSRASSASAGISSSFTPPISTAFSLMHVKPALRAASRPANVSESEPMRVIFRYFSGSSVSRLTFSRSRPALFKRSAYSASRAPFVVIASSRIPSMARRRRTSSSMPRRTSGSPPVSRTLRTPSDTAARTISSISSNDSTASCGSLVTPSAPMQYTQRQLHRSVTERRRYLIFLPY